MKKFSLKKRHSIRKGQVADVLGRLRAQIGGGESLFSSDNIEILETSIDDLRLFLIGKRPLLMEYNGWIFPTLKGAIERPFPQRRIAVDAGAIPYIMNEADIMRPGITSITPDVKVEGPVQVVDTRYGKPLAIAVALYDAPVIEKSTSGKMCKTIHVVGDGIWGLEI